MLVPGATRSVMVDMSDDGLMTSPLVEFVTVTALETHPGNEVAFVCESLPAAITVATFLARKAAITVLDGAPRQVSQAPTNRALLSPMLMLIDARCALASSPLSMRARMSFSDASMSESKAPMPLAVRENTRAAKMFAPFAMPLCGVPL